MKDPFIWFVITMLVLMLGVFVREGLRESGAAEAPNTIALDRCEDLTDDDSLPCLDVYQSAAEWRVNQK